MNATTNDMIDIAGFWHFAIATGEIEDKVERFWNSLGIGPWQYMTFGSPAHGVRLYGQPSALHVAAAATQVGSLMFGFDKSLATPGPYDEMMNSRGGGAHHLAFLVNNFERACQQMQHRGYKEILIGEKIGQDQDGAASYFDAVADLGTVIELSKMPSRMPEADRIFPDSEAKKPIGAADIVDARHIAVAVYNATATARRYQEVLGIGPWRFFTFSAPAIYRGTQIEYAVRAALAKIGEIELVLEEPLSPSGPVQDFLRANGQGIHHISLEAGDFRQASDAMCGQGYGMVLSTSGIGPNRDGEVAYFDTEKALGIMVELVKPPSGDLFA